MKAFKAQGILKEITAGEKASRLTLTAMQNGRPCYTTMLVKPEVAAMASGLVGQAVEVKGGLSFRKQEDPTRNPVSLFGNSIRGIEGTVVSHTSKSGNTTDYLEDGGTEAYLEGNLVDHPRGNENHSTATIAVNSRDEVHYFDLVAFKDQVAALEGFTKGARVKVRGKVENSTWVRNGFTYHRSRVVVDEVQNARMASGLPQRGSVGVPAPVAAVAVELFAPQTPGKKKGAVNFGAFPT